MLRIRELFLIFNSATKHRVYGRLRWPTQAAVFFSLATLFGLAALAVPCSKAEAAGTASNAASVTAPGERLAHARVSGRLGPWRRAEVVLTQSSELDDAPFSGVVIARDLSGNEVRAALPRPDEPDSLFMMKVRSVMFRNVDRSPDNELIVLYSAAKIGPQQSPYYASCVYKWQKDGSFVRLPNIEKTLQGARDSKAVGKYLLAAAKRDTP